MSVDGEEVQEMKLSFPHFEMKKVFQERMALLWTAEESTCWCGLKREGEVRNWKWQRDNKYALQEFSYKGVLAESRKELAGVGVEGWK